MKLGWRGPGARRGRGGLGGEAVRLWLEDAWRHGEIAPDEDGFQRRSRATRGRGAPKPLSLRTSLSVLQSLFSP